MKIARSVLLTLVLAAVAALAAGCGSSSSGSGGDADPASAIPAGAPIYVEADVHPDGKLGADVTAVLKKVLRTDDPAAKLHGLIDDAAKDHGVTYDKDIAPWLGDRVGVAVTSYSGSKAAFVAVSGSKDDAKARAALTKDRKVIKRAYKGVDYSYDPKDQSASAAFGGRAFAGTESAVKAAIDATKGQSLADGNGLRAAREKVASERAAFAYFDVPGLLRLFQQSAGGRDPQVGAALQTFAGALPKTIAAALEADPDLIRVDAVSIGTPRSAGSGKSGADAVGRLPGDAFAAAGFADLGASIDRSLKSLGGSGLGGVGIEVLMRQFRQQTGLDLRADLLSWMGDAGVYVSGDTVSDLHGALVVKSSDPARTRKAIGALQHLARGAAGKATVRGLSGSGIDRGFSITGAGSPRIDVALAGDEFVVAIGGAKALSDAIKPASTLGSAPAFSAAGGSLGDGIKPSFFLDMTRLTALTGSKAGSNAGFAKVKPYLDTLAALVAGAKDEGEGVTRSRFAITLK
ncbi:MAG: DUF3352 domain-containing protein [Actinomycetota bacterium]|nr:DUF3352 domain-containing protein [Actinomycetota bacterium]